MFASRLQPSPRRSLWNRLKKPPLFTPTVNHRSGESGAPRSAKCRLFYSLTTAFVKSDWAGEEDLDLDLDLHLRRRLQITRTWDEGNAEDGPLWKEQGPISHPDPPADPDMFCCCGLFCVQHISRLISGSDPSDHLRLLCLQEWNWIPVKPGARCSSVRQCAACSPAPRAGPTPCRAPPVASSSARLAEKPGETATPAQNSSPWCHPRPPTGGSDSARSFPRVKKSGRAENLGPKPALLLDY